MLKTSAHQQSLSRRSSLTILVECRRCNDIIDDHIIAFKRTLIHTRRERERSFAELNDACLSLDSVYKEEILPR